MTAVGRCGAVGHTHQVGLTGGTYSVRVPTIMVGMIRVGTRLVGMINVSAMLVGKLGFAQY